MKPAWDKLIEEFEGHDFVGVFDVDCTGTGKPLCDQNGVRGFPTIKYGDPSNLEDYSGGRDFDSLKAHADGLKPVCSPSQRDLCDPDDLAEIDRLLEKGADHLRGHIAEGEQKIADAETTFKDEVSKLQAAYEKLMKEKDETIAAVKADGMGMAKSVLAHLEKS
jgi:hypothetical protein